MTIAAVNNRESADFEPEVLFPSHPYEAAFVFFALMAYPAIGAGQEGREGSLYATALANFAFWKTSKVKGLRYLREQRNDPDFVAPHKRSFEGLINRGHARLERRLAAYDLYGTILLQGFFQSRAAGRQALREGRAEEAFHMHPAGGPSPLRKEIVDRTMPAPGSVIRNNLGYWSNRLGLNMTGPSADPSERIKYLREHGFGASIPVLHMAHAFEECCREFGPSICGWEHRNPVEAMLMNADIWIWDALKIAEEWRTIPHSLMGLGIAPDMMVKLMVDHSNGEEAPCT